MLDLNYLRENIETARQRLAGRGFLLDVETFQRLDGERKSIIYEVERLRQRRNSASEDIAKLLREKVDVTDKRNEMKLVSQQIKDKEDTLRAVEGKLFQFAATIPNLPDPAVPVGPTDEQNVEVRRAGDPPRPRPHARRDQGPALRHPCPQRHDRWRARALDGDARAQEDAQSGPALRRGRPDHRHHCRIQDAES